MKTDRIAPPVRMVPIVPAVVPPSGILEPAKPALAAQPPPAPAAPPELPAPIVDAPAAKAEPEAEPPKRTHRRPRDEDDDRPGRDLCQRHGGRKVETNGGRRWHCVYSRLNDAPRPQVVAAPVPAPVADPSSSPSPLVVFLRRMWTDRPGQ